MNNLELKINIGKRVAQYRQAKGLTQENLAELLNIGNEAVSRIERGTVMPTVGRLVELATIFECSTSNLLVEMSDRSLDQAIYLNNLIEQLNQEDRQFIIQLVEDLSAKLINK